MAINDISLTAGMRSNLTTLQGTAQLLDRTQQRLSTGKKVNSAIDNPTAFFAAQALNSRASIIDGLKDAMGQAIQTVTAADKGITAITSLIEQAKGIAGQAQSAATGGGYVSQYIDLSGVTAGTVVTIGGVGFTATSNIQAGTNEFYIGGDDNSDAVALYAAVKMATLSPATMTATKVDGNRVYIADSAADLTVGSIVTDQTKTSITESPLLPAADNELSTLQGQYNSLLTQIDQLVSDSGYKGKNLLNSDTLTVKFEGSNSLSIVGFNASSGGLGISAASWTNPSDAATAVTQLDAALSTLRNNSASFSSNLSIVTTRQSFSTDMENTLTEGANKLTLADTNEEGANMLMLQTRNSLGTTALSLSAQAAQSVLRLFG